MYNEERKWLDFNHDGKNIDEIINQSINHEEIAKKLSEDPKSVDVNKLNISEEEMAQFAITSIILNKRDSASITLFIELFSKILGREFSKPSHFAEYLYKTIEPKDILSIGAQYKMHKLLGSDAVGLTSLESILSKLGKDFDSK